MCFPKATLFRKQPFQPGQGPVSTIFSALRFLLHHPNMPAHAALMFIPLSLAGILYEYDPCLLPPTVWECHDRDMGWCSYFLKALGASLAGLLHGLGNHTTLFASLLAAALFHAVGWLKTGPAILSGFPYAAGPLSSRKPSCKTLSLNKGAVPYIHSEHGNKHACNSGFFTAWNVLPFGQQHTFFGDFPACFYVFNRLFAVCIGQGND